MTTLPAVARAGEVALYDAASDMVLRRCLSGSHRPNGGPLEMINFPDPEGRSALSRRHGELIKSLAGFERDTVADAIAEVLGCYSQYHKGAMDKRALRQVVVKYVQELQGLPTWACVKACDSIRMGTAPNISITYPPSTIEVKTLAQSYTAPIRTELEQIGWVLQGVKAPPQLSPEERKGMAVKFQSLGDELRKHERRDDPKPARSYPQLFDHSRSVLREWGQAAVVECMPGVPVSRSLADKLAR